MGGCGTTSPRADGFAAICRADQRRRTCLNGCQRQCIGRGGRVTSQAAGIADDGNDTVGAHRQTRNVLGRLSGASGWQGGTDVGL